MTIPPVHSMDSPIGRTSDSVDDIDLAKIEAIVLEELSDFQKYAACRDAEPQDLRALFVAWASLFLPEALSGNSKRTIQRTAEKLRTSPPPFAEWPSLLSVEIAAYVISDDLSFLETILDQLSTGNGSTRGFILFCASLIADRLHVDEPRFQHAGERAFRSNFGYVERFPALLIAMKGDLELKRKIATRWLEAAKSKEWDCEELESCLANGYFANPFSRDYQWLAQYAGLRLMQARPHDYRQEVLPGLRSQGRTSSQRRNRRPTPQAQLFPQEKRPLSEVVWTRMRSHPFAGESLSLTRRHP